MLMRRLLWCRIYDRCREVCSEFYNITCEIALIGISWSTMKLLSAASMFHRDENAFMGVDSVENREFRLQ